MLDIEILDLIKKLQSAKAEADNIEVKSAKDGCPKRLYDTISAFSNKSGGIILFGIDETDGFSICGVYDAADLQKKMVEQCNQMIPVVRGVLSTLVYDEKVILALEIPEASYEDKSVYYAGAGMVKGSYIRVGDADLRMTDKEIYSMIAFRNNIHDELRVAQRAELIDLDMDKVDEFLKKQVSKRPNFAKLGKERMMEELGIIAKSDSGDFKPTVAGMLCFGIYPQSIFPQWCMTCIAVPGFEVGEVTGVKERFIDNKRIDGTIPEMIEGSIAFLLKNISVKTIIDRKTAKREDKAEYPSNAIREAILNALVHRDYSVHSEGIYIQMRMYKNHIEIQNPGGVFGRLSIDEIGKKKNYDTRNPGLIKILEEMEIIENRGSGIPTMVDEMLSYGLERPEYIDARGNFIVTFYGLAEEDGTLNGTLNPNDTLNDTLNEVEKRIFEEISKNSKVTADDISQTTGIAAITIKRYFSSLQKKGLLVRDGSKKTGHWQIKNS